MQIGEVIKECAGWWAEPEFEKTLARDPKFAAMIFMAWQAGRWSAEDELWSQLSEAKRDMLKRFQEGV